MLPTVDQPDPSGQDRTVAPVCRLLDTRLFRPGSWFVMDADNARVARVRVASMVAGLRLVGRGTVTTVVGRLRPGVVVVDVDATGVQGDAITEQLAAWCARADLWHLVRPSGGAAGRAHVFVVVGDLEDEFRDAVAVLRESWGVGHAMVHVRDAVRPLSAPHRHGGCPRPLGDLPVALRRLEAALADAGAVDQAPAVTAPRRRPVDPFEAALRSRRQRRTPLAVPAAWQESYLEQGVAPLREDLEDQSPSTAELICTGHLVRAGHTAMSAWAVIQASHLAAFARARVDPWRFVERLWNLTVERDHAFLDQRQAAPAGDDEDRAQERIDPSVAAAVDATREALVEHAWTIGDLRARSSVLLVGHELLDRMLRTGTVRVPCPLRDLVLDTGIKTLSTIRTALRSLHSAGVGVLHECFDPAADRGSTSHEFSISIPTSEGVGANHTPSSYTPLGAKGWIPPEVRSLRPTARLLWRALTALPGSSPQTLMHQAQVTLAADAPPTVAQERTALAALTALAQVGAAWCDEDGTWHALTDQVSTHVLHDPAVSSQRAAATARHEALSEHVAAERAAYRAGAGGEWVAARDQACRADRVRARSWWSRLSPAERAQRRHANSVRFHRLDAHAQAQVKHALVERDRRDGIDPARRHQDWCDGLPAQEYARRQVERAARYQSLPQPLQRAHAAAWDAHRQTHGIPRGSIAAVVEAEQHQVLPRGPEDRDTAWLKKQSSVSGEVQLGLFETA